MVKRFWIFIVTLIILLCGCANPQVPTNPDDNSTKDDPVDTTTLRDTALPVGTDGNLWHIAEIDLGRMDYPNLHMVGENLLIVEYLYRENGTARMYMKLTDLKTGAYLAEIDLDCGGYVRIQVQGDRIGLSDSGDGWVKILDASLQELKHYDLGGDWGDWVLSPDMQYVYDLHWENGISRIDLTTQAQVPVMEVREPALMNLGDGELTLSYMDVTTQRFSHGVLNLTTGVISPVQLPVSIGWIAKHGDRYLVTDGSQWERRHFFVGDQHKTTLFNGNQMEILTETGLVYSHDMENRNPALHTMDGKFVSALNLPGGEWIQMGGKIAWCESWGGYFLTTARDGGGARLLFWDPQTSVAGSDLSLETYKPEEPKDHIADESLYQRAKQLGEMYGLDIRIAEECALEYAEFSADVGTNVWQMTAALDTLEKVLSKYPQGFFKQLPYGRLNSIRIELVSGLRRKDWPADATYTSFAAFTQEMGDHYLMVVDVLGNYEGTYYHEFSHIIDRRLEWDSVYRAGALYSEDAWMELQPQGFAYSYSYQAPPENWGDYLNWFVDDYAMTMPTEDRARVMEYAMNDWGWAFVDRPNLIPKLEFYSKCIRDCFDTTGWPEQTVWETILAQAKTQLQPGA